MLRTVITFIGFTLTFLQVVAQNIGINVSNPSASLHVKGSDPNLEILEYFPLLVQNEGKDTAMIVKNNGQIFLSSNTTDHAGLNLRKEATPAYPHLNLFKKSTTEYATIDFRSPSGDVIFWDANSSSSPGESKMLWFFPGQGNPLTLKSNGNVGINKFGPTEKLDVNGELAFDRSFITHVQGNPNEILMSGGANPTKFGNLDSPLNDPSNFRVAKGIRGNAITIGTYKEILYTSIDSIFVNTKLIIDYSVVMQAMPDNCLPVCGDAEITIQIYAIPIPRNIGSPALLYSQPATLNLEKARTFSGRIVTELDPTVLGHNEWVFTLGVFFHSGSKLLFGDDLVQPYGYNKIKVKYYPSN